MTCSATRRRPPCRVPPLEGDLDVLTEDQVVNAVRGHLEAAGWVIESYAHAHQRGDDIVAVQHGRRLRIEAEGGGSSKPGTNRYGQAFTLGQCDISASKATFRALGAVSDGDEAGIAFPDTANYRRVLGPVLPALDTQSHHRLPRQRGR